MFAPAPSSASVKVLATVANAHGLKISHVYVARSYVRTENDMSGTTRWVWEHARKDRPPKFISQSGRQWAQSFVETVVEYGMEQCKSDLCVFCMVVDGKVKLIMAVRIDDIVIAGSDETYTGFHAALATKFPKNNLGELTCDTECDFKCDSQLGTLENTPKAVIESMLNRFGVNSSSDIPAIPGTELDAKEEDEFGGDWPYREAVGSLMWLSTMTRTGISNAVRAVVHHSHNPMETRRKVDLKIMAYLHGTKCLRLTYVRGSGFDLTSYIDADDADKSNDRRSVSGMVIPPGGAAVS